MILWAEFKEKLRRLNSVSNFQKTHKCAYQGVRNFSLS